MSTLSINKYLTPEMHEVLDELDISHSGELVCQHGSWWIDDRIVKEDAVKDLYLMRLIKPIQLTKDEQVYKLTEDGLGCLQSPSYVPKLLSM